MRGLELHPVLPVPQVVALVAVAVALAVWLHRAERRSGFAASFMLALRVAAVSVVGLLILNPVRIRGAEEPGGNSPILVLVDTSHSMSVKDADGDSRIDAIRNALFKPEVAAALSDSHSPTYFAFSKDASVQSPDVLAKPGPAGGTQTFIGEAIARAVSTAGGAEGGAVLLLSDGRDNGDIGPAEVARQTRSRGFPVFTVCVGRETKTKDLSVVMNRPQVFTSPNQSVELSADLVSSGLDGSTATLGLMREGTKVAEKTVALLPGGHTEVSFRAQEREKGTYRYSMAVEPAPGEVTTANNRASSLLTVGNETTQVLVLEGRPTWDAKFLIQALRSDPSLSVDSAFQIGPNRPFAIQGVTAETPEGKGKVQIPRNRVQFSKYDVVILGKGFDEFYGATEARELKQYVAEQGGHLIFLRGEASKGSKELAALEPVSWGSEEVHDLRMKITSEGTMNPAFDFGGLKNPDTVIQKLPTLISATRVAQEKALSVVLARAPGTQNSEQPSREMAVLAYQRYGDGMVLSLVGQGLWRWALLPPELEEYRTCYNDFWTQLVRWLVNQSDFLPGQNLALRTDHLAFSPGETVTLMAFVRGAARANVPPATIVGPDGKVVKIALGKATGKQADFVGSFKPNAPGDYVATLSQPGSRGGQVTAPFSVYEHAQEDLNTSADPDLMRRIAKAGGGRTLALNEIGELPGLINETNAWFQKKPEPQSLWDRWQILALILGLLSVEWIVRRRLGMV